LRSPKWADYITATNGEQLEEVIENTGRTEFWLSTAVLGVIRLRMSKRRAEARTINVKQTIEKRMSRTIEQNG
jgi:hypothetical protein